VVSVEAPLNVKNGEEFIITTTVQNTDPSQKQTLVSLDIADAYLEGIAILGTAPDSKEARHIPFDNTMSYVFDIPIPSGEVVEVALRAKAVKPGDFNAEVDFCINSGVSFLSKPVRTIVD
jgi:type 1 fimbria pilin